MQKRIEILATELWGTDVSKREEKNIQTKEQSRARYCSDYMRYVGEDDKDATKIEDKYEWKSGTRFPNGEMQAKGIGGVVCLVTINHTELETRSWRQPKHNHTLF